jgi:hypothetical protein
MATRVVNTWSLYLEDGNVHIKVPTLDYKIVKVQHMKPGGWRIYRNQTDYILVVLSDQVRFETDPNYVIKHPDTINMFFKTYL